MANAEPISRSLTPPATPAKSRDWVKIGLITVAVGYLGLVLFIPALNVFVQAFSKGLAPLLSNMSQPVFLHAVQLTLICALIAVPLNTIFGLCAAWAITRHQFPGRAFVVSVLD
ncbi:MAG TPA: sulfate ABC transporter permease subunit CysW, partial [Microcoleaceae cyanobacterium]